MVHSSFFFIIFVCLCVIAFEDFYRNTIFKNLASLSDKLITNGGFFICSTSSHSDAKISTLFAVWEFSAKWLPLESQIALDLISWSTVKNILLTST